jgi:beta-ureidopropionase / N-carbamoyl-L-amino-acid hydrolase
VLAGLEVLEVLNERNLSTERPISVAFFTNEEGARFQPDMLGSLVFAGGMSVEDAYDVSDAAGVRLGDELLRIGYAGVVPCPVNVAPHAFVELHIEQGPVLEDEGVTIGVVTGVQGISWTELTIRGQSAHAGTTPIRLRRDPGLVAAAITTGVRALADEFGGSQVATVGRVEFQPNLVNVVPASVVMTVDLRNTDEAVLSRAEQRFEEMCTALADAEHVSIERRSLARFEPVDFDPAMIDAVERTAVSLGHSTKRMPSGAGHDAQMLARICPAAMIFTQSVNGLSHNQAELTLRDDLRAGADVLLNMLVELAG